LIISKFPKNIAGRTKCPGGSHVARVFETLFLSICHLSTDWLHPVLAQPLGEPGGCLGCWAIGDAK